MKLFRSFLLKIQDKTFEHERKIEEIKELQEVPGTLLLWKEELLALLLKRLWITYIYQLPETIWFSFIFSWFIFENSLQRFRMLHYYFNCCFGSMREIWFFDRRRSWEVLADKSISKRFYKVYNYFFTRKKIIFISIWPRFIIKGANLELVILVIVNVEAVARSSE